MVSVILYHAGYSLFSGGFIGVDVFFVISGFLIGSILFNELERGNFSYVKFLERRARRILPALTLVLAITVLLGALILFPDDFKRLGASLSATAAFASNILFWNQTGYFDAVSEYKPLIHMWSLAVEEQFYIFFPPALLLLWRYARTRLWWILAAITLASFALAELTVRVSPDTAFFLPHSRAWELLTGVLAAHYVRQSSGAFCRKARELASLFGITMVLASIILLDDSMPFPGATAVPSILGTVLIILFAGPDTLTHKVLSIRPMVGIGLISYSAYLWHQPIFAFFRHLYIPDPHNIAAPILIVITMILAYLSWKFVEAPFRDRTRFNQKKIFTWSCAALATTFIGGLALYFSSGLPWRFSEEVVQLAQTRERLKSPTDNCTLRIRKEDDLRAQVEGCYVPGNTLYLIGDSHAHALSYALRAEADRNGITLIVLSESACAPIPEASSPKQSKNCDLLKQQMRALTRTFPAPVILASRWRLFTSGETYDNREGGLEFGPKMPMIQDGKLVDQPVALVEAALTDWANDVPLVVVDNIPEAGWLVKQVMARRMQMGSNQTKPLSTSYAVYKSANRDIIAMFDRLEQDRAISIFRTAPLVCDELTGRCLNERDGEPLYYDDDHPDLPYAKDIAAGIFGHLRSRELIKNSTPSA